jgi:hypothetical protein
LSQLRLQQSVGAVQAMPSVLHCGTVQTFMVESQTPEQQPAFPAQGVPAVPQPPSVDGTTMPASLPLTADMSFPGMPLLLCEQLQAGNAPARASMADMASKLRIGASCRDRIA